MYVNSEPIPSTEDEFRAELVGWRELAGTVQDGNGVLKIEELNEGFCQSVSQSIS